MGVAILRESTAPAQTSMTFFHLSDMCNRKKEVPWNAMPRINIFASVEGDDFRRQRFAGIYLMTTPDITVNFRGFVTSCPKAEYLYEPSALTCQSSYECFNREAAK
jgi:hypothetical protein